MKVRRCLTLFSRFAKFKPAKLTPWLSLTCYFCVAGEDLQWCAAEGGRPEPQSPLWWRLPQSELSIFGQYTVAAVMYDISRRHHKRRVINITSCWSTATSSSTTWRTGWRRWTRSDSRSGTPRHLLSSKESLSSESWGQMSCWVLDSFDIESDDRRHPGALPKNPGYDHVWYNNVSFALCLWLTM